uniref:Uncharacterized protein n=1 Tax=Panagrolaimus superbus TaxID=310955 RepID=A0A914Y5I3_9BILA
MSEDAKDEEVLPPRKRGRMAFLTKDHLRHQVGHFIDKGARAEQLLKESEEKLKNANQKIQTLESRLQNAEEENVAFVKSIGILVQEIKNIRENHEKEIQEKNETYKEWVTVYTEKCQKFIVAEKVKWITEIFKQFENEKQKVSSDQSFSQRFLAILFGAKLTALP